MWNSGIRVENIQIAFILFIFVEFYIKYFLAKCVIVLCHSAGRSDSLGGFPILEAAYQNTDLISQSLFLLYNEERVMTMMHLNVQIVQPPRDHWKEAKIFDGVTLSSIARFADRWFV